MALYIRDAETDRLVRELARLKRVNLTQAVKLAGEGAASSRKRGIATLPALACHRPASGRPRRHRSRDRQGILRRSVGPLIPLDVWPNPDAPRAADTPTDLTPRRAASNRARFPDPEGTHVRHRFHPQRPRAGPPRGLPLPADRRRRLGGAALAHPAARLDRRAHHRLDRLFLPRSRARHPLRDGLIVSPADGRICLVGPCHSAARARSRRARRCRGCASSCERVRRPP